MTPEEQKRQITEEESIARVDEGENASRDHPQLARAGDGGDRENISEEAEVNCVRHDKQCQSHISHEQCRQALRARKQIEWGENEKQGSKRA